MAMIRIIPLFIPVIVVGVGVLSLFFIALYKAGPVGRWFFTIAGLFLLLLLGSLYMHGAQRPVEVVQTHLAGIELPVRTSQSSIEDSVFWQDNLEEELIPDTYSSIPRAAYGLGMQLEETIEEALGQPPSEILILETSSLSKSDLNELRNGLKSQYEETNIYFGQRPAGEFRAGMICIGITLSEGKKHETTVSTGSDTSLIFLSGQTGKLEATVETGKGKYYKGVSFDYRQWLWDRPAFLSDTPGKQWVTAVSNETAMDAFQARQEAMNQAASKVFNMLQGSGQFLGRNFILKQEDLERYGFVADEYSQELKGMAGPIWRHAVLLDVSPQRMQSLVSAKTKVVCAQRNTWMRLMVSLGGMILLVCVVYFIANAATKGYYSTVLAVSAVTAAVILGLIILNFA